MNKIIMVLRVLNYLIGTTVLVVGFLSFLLYRSPVPLLLALALTAVGPVEDILNKKLHLSNIDPSKTKEIVNQSTSLTFVILLLAAILIAL